MPHPTYTSLNDADLVATRAVQREADHKGTYPSVQVGVPLILRLLAAYDAARRLRDKVGAASLHDWNGEIGDAFVDAVDAVKGAAKESRG